MDVRILTRRQAIREILSANIKDKSNFLWLEENSNKELENILLEEVFKNKKALVVVVIPDDEDDVNCIV